MDGDFHKEVITYFPKCLDEISCFVLLVLKILVSLPVYQNMKQVYNSSTLSTNIETSSINCYIQHFWLKIMSMDQILGKSKVCVTTFYGVVYLSYHFT